MPIHGTLWAVSYVLSRIQSCLSSIEHSGFSNWLRRRFNESSISREDDSPKYVQAQKFPLTKVEGKYRVKRAGRFKPLVTPCKMRLVSPGFFSIETGKKGRTFSCLRFKPAFGGEKTFSGFFFVKPDGARVRRMYWNH